MKKRSASHPIMRRILMGVAFACGIVTSFLAYSLAAHYSLYEEEQRTIIIGGIVVVTAFILQTWIYLTRKK